MSDRTPERSSKEPSASLVEVVHSCQGLIIIVLGIGLFACLPLVSKDIKPDWTSFCQIVLSVGATAINSGDTKKQVFQRGRKFETVEGDVVNQDTKPETSETDPNESSTY